jgi:hypothetical protein
MLELGYDSVDYKWKYLKQLGKVYLWSVFTKYIKHYIDFQAYLQNVQKFNKIT